MKITKYCKDECPKYCEKCEELESIIDKKSPSTVHSLCFCCERAGYECRKYLWNSPFGDYPFRPGWKFVGARWIVYDCERFIRG